ncbi:hypothetical protein ES703_80122 [subsurface metagenome]
MDRGRLMRLSQVEARELKDLVDAEIERQLDAIKVKLDSLYGVAVGIEADEAWSGLRSVVLELVKSDLAELRRKLDLLLGLPPEEAPEEEEPGEEVPEPEPVEPAEEPEPEEAKGK